MALLTTTPAIVRVRVESDPATGIGPYRLVTTWQARRIADNVLFEYETWTDVSTNPILDQDVWDSAFEDGASGISAQAGGDAATVNPVDVT